MSRFERGPSESGLSQDSRPESRVLSIETEDATTIFDCLSSATAREILAALHEEAVTASELAETADTSIQNVRYHLEKFRDAGLIEIVDSRTSSRGMEMDVYAPSDQVLVLYGGQPERTDTSIPDLLRGLLSAVSVLAALSLLIEIAVPMILAPMLPGDTAPGDGAGGIPGPVVLDIGGMIVSPGLVFFAGGVLVLVVITMLAMRHPEDLLIGAQRFP